MHALGKLIQYLYYHFKIVAGDDTRPEFKGLRMALEGSSYVGKCKVAMTKVFVLERGICYGNIFFFCLV